LPTGGVKPLDRIADTLFASFLACRQIRLRDAHDSLRNPG